MLVLFFNICRRPVNVRDLPSVRRRLQNNCLHHTRVNGLIFKRTVDLIFRDHHGPFVALQNITPTKTCLDSRRECHVSGHMAVAIFEE